MKRLIATLSTAALLAAGLVVAGSVTPAAAHDGGNGKCVTKHEWSHAKPGVRKARVHAIFDTPGRFAGRGPDGYTRQYRACWGSVRLYVDYHGGTQRVGAKRALSGGRGVTSTTTFTDPADRSGFDIRRVKVDYSGNWLNVRVGHEGRIVAPSTYKFWFDTVRANRGPEYLYRFSPNSDWFSFQRVDGFRDRTRKNVSCSTGGRADIFRPYADVLALVSARCLDGAKQVRVSMKIQGDWAPGRYRFSSWVRR